MGIQTTVGHLAEVVEGKVLAKIEAGEPPWKYRFACAKFCALVVDEYNRFARLRDALVRKYGVEDKEKRTIAIAHPSNTLENITAFNDALGELLASPVELATEPLSSAKLGDAFPLTVGDLRVLGPLIAEG